MRTSLRRLHRDVSLAPRRQAFGRLGVRRPRCFSVGIACAQNGRRSTVRGRRRRRSTGWRVADPAPWTTEEADRSRVGCQPETAPETTSGRPPWLCATRSSASRRRGVEVLRRSSLAGVTNRSGLGLASGVRSRTQAEWFRPANHLRKRQDGASARSLFSQPFQRSMIFPEPQQNRLLADSRRSGFRLRFPSCSSPLTPNCVRGGPEVDIQLFLTLTDQQKDSPECGAAIATSAKAASGGCK